MVDAPTNVHFNDTNTEDELTIDWDEVTNADGYYIYRALSSGSSTSDYTKIATPTTPPYTDTGLSDGEKYYYRVSSYISYPDSVASRPDDTYKVDSSDARGLKFDTNEDWPSIQGEISSLASNADNAYIIETNGTVIDSIDISNLTSGDIFTFDNINLNSGTYYMAMDNGAASYTTGYKSSPGFPLTDSDGDLTIESGVYDAKTDTPTEASYAYNIKRLGNINL